MTAEVITFAPRAPAEPLIWVCNCGCTTHYHRTDDGVECASCGNVAADLSGEWRAKLSDAPDEPRELDSTTFRVTPLDTAATFMQRHAKRGSGDVVAILILNDDGSFATWSGDMTGEDRAAWLKRQLAKVWDRLTGVKPI